MYKNEFIEYIKKLGFIVSPDMFDDYDDIYKNNNLYVDPYDSFYYFSIDRYKWFDYEYNNLTPFK